MDTYRIFSGLNGCNKGLEVRAGFQFLFKEGLQFLNGKNFNHIINESVQTNTPACALHWMEWRQAKDFKNFIVDCLNVNTKFSDESHKLEKTNLASNSN